MVRDLPEPCVCQTTPTRRSPSPPPTSDDARSLVPSTVTSSATTWIWSSSTFSMTIGSNSGLTGRSVTRECRHESPSAVFSLWYRLTVYRWPVSGSCSSRSWTSTVLPWRVPVTGAERARGLYRRPFEVGFDEMLRVAEHAGCGLERNERHAGRVPLGHVRAHDARRERHCAQPGCGLSLIHISEPT